MGSSSPADLASRVAPRTTAVLMTGDQKDVVAAAGAPDPAGMLRPTSDAVQPGIAYLLDPARAAGCRMVRGFAEVRDAQRLEQACTQHPTAPQVAVDGRVLDAVGREIR
jgi:hypothetical protein